MGLQARYRWRRMLQKLGPGMSARGTAVWVSLSAALSLPQQVGAQLEFPAPAPQAPAAQLSEAVDEGVKVLERGPVHEAFAEPLDLKAPLAGPVIAHEPPAPIEEAPAEMRPDDDRADWIGGYWAWSDEHNEFIWVSGVWRIVPPGRNWTPGYWTKVQGGGFQWVSGYWALADEERARLLPMPPASLEAGPSSSQPGANFFWIPGCWRWQAARYMWQPGYWHAGHAHWVWIPNHYIATPSGCFFVPGYWDFEPVARGWLFAPARIPRTRFGQIGFVYRPAYIVDPRLLLTALFVDPRHGHYCFGAYDPVAVAHLGLHRWCDARGTGFVDHYDPLAAYYRHRHGAGHDAWVRDLKSDYDRLLNPAHRKSISIERSRRREEGGLLQSLEHISQHGSQIVRARRLEASELEDWKHRHRDPAARSANPAVVAKPLEEKETTSNIPRRVRSSDLPSQSRTIKQRPAPVPGEHTTDLTSPRPRTQRLPANPQVHPQLNAPADIGTLDGLPPAPSPAGKTESNAAIRRNMAPGDRPGFQPRPHRRWDSLPTTSPNSRSPYSSSGGAALREQMGPELRPGVTRELSAGRAPIASEIHRRQRFLPGPDLSGAESHGPAAFVPGPGGPGGGGPGESAGETRRGMRFPGGGGEVRSFRPENLRRQRFPDEAAPLFRAAPMVTESARPTATGGADAADNGPAARSAPSRRHKFKRP